MAKKTIICTGSFQDRFVHSLCVDADVQGTGDGVYCYGLDEALGALTPASTVAGLTQPARLWRHAASGRIYAASDTRAFLNWEPGTGGGVYCLSPAGAGWTPTARRSSCGVRAVDVCGTPDGRFVLVLNEGSEFCTTAFAPDAAGRWQPHVRWDEGCVTVLQAQDGGFARVCSRYVFETGTPAHPCAMRLCGNELYVADRGGGCVLQLRLDPETGTLHPLAQLPTGAAGAPTDVAAHPTLPVCYAACPAGGKILVCRRTAEGLAPAEAVFEEEPSCPGRLLLSPQGTTLYAADADGRQIKVYAVCEDGGLVLRQRVDCAPPAAGEGALFDLALTPSGRWLLATDLPGGRLLAFPAATEGSLGAARVWQAPSPSGLLIFEQDEQDEEAP